MDRFEFEFLKTTILKKPEMNFEKVSILCDQLQKRFGFGIFDVFEMYYKCPALCDYSASAIEDNLKEFEKCFAVSSRQMKYFVLKFPFILVLNHKLLEYKINLLSTVFAVSKIEVLDKIMLCPDLLFISKAEIVNQTKMLSDVFDEFGEGIRRLLRVCPELLFVSKDHIKSLERIMFYDFSFSNKESNIIFKTCPELVFNSPEQLKDLFMFYYSKYFVKRDLKEMIPRCPQFLFLSPSAFKEKLEMIQNALDSNEKEALLFIRRCPNILFFDNPKTKLHGFKKFAINMEFLKFHPDVCICQEFSIPLKFVLARILGLESDFEELCKINTKTLVSRFLFMQSKHVYTHQDLLLSDEEFFKKYNVSSDVLKICYIVTDDDLQKICKYYVDLKDTLPKWTDIVFPDVKDVERFLKEKLRENFSCPSYDVLREKYQLTKKQYTLLSSFLSLYLDRDECMFLINKCKSLTKCSSKNVLNTVNFLRKQGFAFEHIVQLLIEKPTLFTYFIGDLENVFENVSKFYGCSAKEAVEYIC